MEVGTQATQAKGKNRTGAQPLWGWKSGGRKLGTLWLAVLLHTQFLSEGHVDTAGTGAELVSCSRDGHLVSGTESWDLDPRWNILDLASGVKT
jgi:hypothetical protein